MTFGPCHECYSGRHACCDGAPCTCGCVELRARLAKQDREHLAAYYRRERGVAQSRWLVAVALLALVNVCAAAVALWRLSS